MLVRGVVGVMGLLHMLKCAAALRNRECKCEWFQTYCSELCIANIA